MKEGVCPSILLHWRRWLSAKKVHSQVSHPPSTSSILSLLGAQASGGTRRQGERVLCEATVGNRPPDPSLLSRRPPRRGLKSRPQRRKHLPPPGLGAFPTIP